MKPQNLASGDSVIVLSPSGKVEEEKIRKSVQFLTEWGLSVSFGSHVFDSHHKMAGTDQNRKEDLQSALDDPTIKAIFCARGGYGLVRIIDEIDFTKFLKNPKWIVGFSDVTVLHNQLNRLGVASIHAPMPNSYLSTPGVAMESLRRALFDPEYQLKTTFSEKEIVGGNLAIIYSLLGTNSDIQTKEKVLLIEDIGEYAYNIDRMMHSLKKAGKFKELAGLMVGHFTGVKEDDFGYSIREIINHTTAEFDFPVEYDVPVGHVDDNRAIILGK